MRFQKLLGNDGLKRQLSGEALPHALILTGEAGSGRHTAAGEIAQAMVCTGPSPAPCGLCPNCRKAAQGIHPDVMGLDRFVEESDRGKELRVYAVRAIREDAQVRPNEAPCKVYILDQPINPQAQNALLKLLEDGPEYARFLILTENSASLLETVRSRCAQVHTSPLTEELVFQWLQEHQDQQPEERLRQCAFRSQGRIGRALQLLEEEGEDPMSAEAGAWIRALSGRSELALMECVAATQRKQYKREQGEALYHLLMETVHQALLPRMGEALPQTLREQAESLKGSWSQQQLLALYQLLNRAREMGKSNVSVPQSAGWLAVRSLEIV